MKKVLQIVIVLCIAFQGFAQNHETQKKEINKGIVLDEDGNPFPDVKVNIKDTKGETKTNLYGVCSQIKMNFFAQNLREVSANLVKNFDTVFF